MGFWDSYWKWAFSDDEEFVDTKRGIYYKANGTTRSMRGMFRNWGLEEPKDNAETEKILKYLIKKGKVKKEDLIEYGEETKLLR